MNQPRRRRIKISQISSLHYAKLFFRSFLLLLALIVYIYNRIYTGGDLFDGLENSPFVLLLIWLVFVAEMIFRFYPSRLESMGCQKQFARNYIPTTGKATPRPGDICSPQATATVAGFWLLLNGAIGALYLAQFIDRGILFLICLAFSVCDMICILYFCPFQNWIMKNKCCGSCRIYNWDYAMMFTPLIFVPTIYTWSLLGLALALLMQWEITYRRHPHRFSETTNQSLSCARCQEKLCRHKKSLRRFLQKQSDRLSRLH